MKMRYCFVFVKMYILNIERVIPEIAEEKEKIDFDKVRT